MATSKKNSNKTAHVLNVITAGQEVNEESAGKTVPQPAPAVGQSPAPPHMAVPAPMPTAPIVEVEPPSEDLADQVREALSEELEAEEAEFTEIQPEVIIPSPQPAVPASPAPVAASPAATPVIPVPQRTAPPVPAPAPPAPTPVVPIPQRTVPPVRSIPTHPVEADESEYINIMQALVDEKTPQYVKLLGVCTCSRCLADIKALALSNLEPKYIVIHKSQNLPYTVYDNRYNAAVTSQIISACRVVMKNPRHTS